MHEDRAVGLDHQHPLGHGQMGGEPADVINLTPSDDQTHPTRVDEGFAAGPPGAVT
jgi:hypothetical protein